MSEDKPAYVEGDEKQTSRRSRKDEQGRDYVCGCGKRYLSYPALYTHIKTKHEGKQPEGTQKTGVNMVIKRGKLKFEEDVLKSILAYVDKSDLLILKEVDEGCEGSVSITSRIKKETLPKEIYECYSNLIKSTTPVELTKNSTLDLVLTVYLLGVGEFVCQKMFDHYVMFVKTLRNCYYQHGDELYEACFKQKDGIAYLPNFNVEKCNYLPIICDFYARYYIAADLKECSNLALIELLLYDFCVWMTKKGLTTIRVVLNKNYHLQNKSIIGSNPAKGKNSPSKNGSSKQNHSSEVKKQNGEDQEELASQNHEQNEAGDIEQNEDDEQSLHGQLLNDQSHLKSTPIKKNSIASDRSLEKHSNDEKRKEDSKSPKKGSLP